MARDPRQILIDVGNGRVKFGLASATAILERREHATPGLSAAQVRQVLDGWPALPAILCTVVPAVLPVFQEALGARLHVLTHQADLGIGIRYPEPASIGPDRLANAIALAHQYGAPGIGIDFGTAVTFDIVAADACYIGGIIAPGLRLMTDYLHERTALLPRVDLREPPHAIGQSTQEAILAGAAIGYRGMVQGLLDAVKAELPPTPRAPVVVATGGDAAWIIQGMRADQPIHVDPDLTLHGLRLFGNRIL
ncbi:MAG: type III pantothenate kinase [Verrucomicrobiales bacterium]|nr:type III pantothenate kinase [Verrucomicrobiales bacterium]